MATGGSIDGSDEIINIKCCICDKKNIRKEADKYCVECQDYYCTPCADMHKTFLPNASGHKLLDKSDFGSTGLRSGLPSYPTERCSVHQAKLLDIYCKDHDEVICSTCLLSHRTCQHIHSIPDEFDHLYESAASDDFRSQLIEAKKNMEAIKKANETLLKDVDKFKKKATDSIKQYRKEIETVLDRLESQSAKEIEEMYGKLEERLKKDIKEAEENAANLEESVNKLQKAGENKAQEFIYMKTAEKNINKAKHANKRGLLYKPNEVEIPFHADTKVIGFLQKLQKLGQVDTTNALSNPNTTVYNVKSVKEVDITNASTKPNTAVYNVKSVKEINAKVPTDKKDCCFHDSCFTLDDLLLLSDYENKCLKRIEVSSGLVKDTLNLKCKCGGVCMTNPFEAAVCMIDKSIQFVSLGNKIVAAQQLKLDHQCYGIVCNNNQLFITDGSTTLYIHDMKGNMLNKVTVDGTGASIFSRTRNVTAFGDRVYVADQDKRLVILDTEGNYKTTFKHSDLVEPFGVCTDRRGNIFVSGSSKIVQINENPLSVLGVLDTVTNSLSACFDQHQNRLVITQFKKNSVKVYKLE